MIAVDTSVVVAAFATWHEAHSLATEVMSESPHLPAPCALEAYAVLTRLPAPHRSAPGLVRDYLSTTFPGDWLTLPRARSRRLFDDLVMQGIAGGASYDAVVALVASLSGATLVTLDRRARLTYELMGVEVRFLA